MSRITRRALLAGGATLPLLRSQGTAPASRPQGRLLVLGGTRFLGPPIVRAALAAGLDVTLFNRGRSNPGLFPALRQLQGDRDTGDLASLRTGTWDLVIDTSAYAPLHVTQVCELLRERIGHYLLVSTVSVYADTSPALVDESAPTSSATPEQIAKATTIREGSANYGPMKAECERAAERAMPGRVTVVRPGLIVGPEDASDRFTYWPVRVARGGEVLAPGTPDGEVQFVDVRDLGEWCVTLGAARPGGVFNAVGFRGRLSLAELLHGCKVTLNTECSFTWVDDAFLLAQKVRPYTELPLWLPRGRRGRFDNRKAVGAGLKFRSIADTIRDTEAWHRTRPANYTWRGGLSAAREQELLTAFRARAK